MRFTFILSLAFFCLAPAVINAIERKILRKHTNRNHVISELPYEVFYRGFVDSMPESFNWRYHDGINYLTRSQNQHLPNYCESSWAHAAMSVLADRIKINRINFLQDEGDEYSEDQYHPDVHLSVQFLLNCGGDTAGTCNGGSATGAFQFIREAGFIPFETCQPYLGCSSDSPEEFCQHVDTTCTPMNICKTCVQKSSGFGSTCSPVSQFPYARVEEYGVYELTNAQSMADHIFAIKSEIHLRGPVTAGIAGHYLKNYTGGIIYDEVSLRNMYPTHEVSITGWDVDPETGVEYWIARNSWGEYWGEMSFFRLALGTNMLGIETEISWVTLDDFSLKNVPCHEDGRNCNLAALNFIPGVGQSV